MLIFADDLGWKDVGYQGTDFYETPNIDRLAKECMFFSAGYAAAGNCAPSRACLMSGQYTPRHGVYAVGSTNRGPANLMRMTPVPNSQSLPAENVTVAEALRAAGYATGFFGKWHLGSGECSPEQQGFEVVLEKNGNQKIGPDPKAVYTLTKAACKFMEANRDRPFFAYIPHHAIHTPLQARKSTFEKFTAKPAGKQHDNVIYAACTFDLDDGVGMVLEKLKELGLEDNTLVVFTSDNGGTPQSSQEPLRGAKGCYYEGGIREPFIVRWPGVTKPGAVCDVPVINVDLYPTFLAAAGAKVPQGKTLDGESLAPLLSGEGKLSREAIFWHFPGYLDRAVPRGRDPVFRTRPVTVIHKGNWKLHLYHEEWLLDGGRDKLAANNAVELYDLSEDIGERKNIAGANTQKRDELLDDVLAWWKKTGALLPSPK
ncbi:MAG: sulfatase [Planctomycetales bacterium]|nr:sulfatase [Planctomycetales bacterium]